MPNKLSQFWQELKRRNVSRVLTVYIAVAFMILELVDMISDPFGLPDWSMKVAFFILIAGLIIAVIVSWIYDMGPAVGIVKTESVHKVKPGEEHTGSNSWRIASYISFVVIVALIVVNIIPRSSNKKILEKSIAVLPFINDSEEIGNEHIINGIMEEILINLQSIKELRVLGRTSTEQYRNNPKPIPEIANELNVAYIVEGSGQRYGNKIRLRVQLVEGATDKHMWADSYDEEIKGPEDIFRIQSQIAESIAAELEAVVTPEEKKRIDEIPTEDLNAYEYYLLGRNRLNNILEDADSWRAIDYFQQAINIDPAFALAYSALADAYYHLTIGALLSPGEAYPKVSEYSQKALELNEELAYTHCLLGIVKLVYEYDYSGAEKEFIRALEIDPKSVEAHTYYARLHFLFRRTDEAIVHIDRALELDPQFYWLKLIKSELHFSADSINEAMRLLDELRNSYPYIPAIYWISAVFYTHLGRYEEALSMLDTQLALMEDDNISDEIGLQGFIYGRLDLKDEALKQQARLDELSLKGYYVSPRTRVWIYLGLDNLDEAFAVLEKAYNDHSIDPVSFILYFYPIESLQSDPRFKEYLQKIGLNN